MCFCKVLTPYLNYKACPYFSVPNFHLSLQDIQSKPTNDVHYLKEGALLFKKHLQCNQVIFYFHQTKRTADCLCGCEVYTFSYLYKHLARWVHILHYNWAYHCLTFHFKCTCNTTTTFLAISHTAVFCLLNELKIPTKSIMMMMVKK